jgi:protein-S-isoprenylcysteine O-methyltransferase Ste14
MRLKLAGFTFALGAWLHRYRQWGLIPLFIVGFLLRTSFLATERGYFMMGAGAIGVLFGTLLRVVCYTFTGGYAPFSKARAPLIVDGPYAITRNPVYLGEAAMALGIAMMSQTTWFVLVTVLFTAFILGTIVEWEETTLRAQYGEAYDAYCKTVPRWFRFRRLTHRDSFTLTRGRVRLLSAVRAESLTVLIGLSTIFAYLVKADFFQFF